ncbi:MAG: acyl-CoA dehydrogenase family protein [Intrasporangium sp.]|uniref:acyl-CoA dehydrogenase family protein n=1 Tax=Intrasporangium sp. TaxID=1925024 RepID=UPI0026472471|nr:acyl-CoA dehydrogenase family protein [Intrasporangium sp.]MDN5795317.1 acyl-CoA dehydrogenase family protein [Intrasporangium sp.]
MTRPVRETAALSESERAFVDELDRVAVGLAADRTAARGAGRAPQEGRVDRDLVAALGRAGLLRKLFGGGAGNSRAGVPSGAAALQLCLLRESLARVDTGAETALALQGLGSYPILQSGTPEQVARWLPGVISGELVAAFALSEPDAGSDAAALALEARPDGAGWTLHGIKTWISNAPDADVYSVFARTGPGAGSKGVTAFVVDGGAAGLTGQPLEMLSPHAIGRLDFDGVRVGPTDVLGEVGQGFVVAMRTLDLFRPSVGAFAVGMAQFALEAAVEWVTSRAIYGGLLGDQQAVQHVLAEMATRIDAGRLLVHRAARAYDAGLPPREVSAMAAMAKLFATETAQWVVDQSVQLHGARALQRGHPLEHLYRDVRAPRIYEGASEVQRTIIARHLIAQHGARRGRGAEPVTTP